MAQTLRVNELIKRRMVYSAVLAGGKGMRMGHTCDPSRNRWAVAKPAVQVGGGALIDFSLRSLAKLGIKEINLMTGHLPRTILHRVGNGEFYGDGLKIQEQRDEKETLGTAGEVVSLAGRENWHEKPGVVIVASGDILHNIDIGQVLDNHIYNHEKNGAVATIVTYPGQWNHLEGYGSVRLEGMPVREDYKTNNDFEDAVSKWLKERERETGSRKILEFREKAPRFPENSLSEDQSAKSAAVSNLINASIYVFETSLFGTLLRMATSKDGTAPISPALYQPEGPVPFSDWGKHVLKWLAGNAHLLEHPIYAYIPPANTYWRDVADNRDLQRANRDVIDRKIDTGTEGFAEYRNRSYIGRNTYINQKAFVSRSIIGNNVRIGPHACIVNSVVGSDTVVKKDVKMYGSVIFQRHVDMSGPNVIGDHSQMANCVFTGGSIIPGSYFHNMWVYDSLKGRVLVAFD